MQGDVIKINQTALETSFTATFHATCLFLNDALLIGLCDILKNAGTQ